MGLPVSSLMSACFVVCVMHLVQVHANNDEKVLTAMVARLQDSVDRQEQLLKDQHRSTEQLLQTFTTSMVEQQKQLSRLVTMLESMYYLSINRDINNDNIPDLSVAPMLVNIKLFKECSQKHIDQTNKIIVSFYTTWWLIFRIAQTVYSLANTLYECYI